MLVCEGQAQPWMKTANWDDPEKSLELRPGDKEIPAASLHDQAWGIARWLHLAIPRAFPKPVDWNKIQAFTENPSEPMDDYYSQLQTENSGLFVNVESTWEDFMFIDRLNGDLFLLVKRSRMEWETMSSPDLINLVNELTCTLGDQTKRKTTKVLNFQLQQMEAAKKT